MIEARVHSPADRRPERKKIVSTVIIASVLVHVVAALGAGFWIVARYFTPPPATFKVEKTIQLPAKEREHQMNVAEFDALTPKPSLQEKITSLRPTEFALPDLPKVPLDQMLPLDASALVSDQVASLVGAAGFGAGGAGMGGMGGSGSGFSFFGIESKGRRIMLLFDVSSSVANKAERAGVPLSRIKEETLKLIESFGINVRFGIIQFTQNYQPFHPELVPANDANKAAARKWVQDEWVETGMLSARKKAVTGNDRGFVKVLEVAYKMEPDVLFVISDGSFQWRAQGGNENIPERELQRVLREGAAGRAVPLNFIGFEMKPEDENFWKRAARQSGGNFRAIHK